ncbi:hypothetical protein SDC9_147711 [bioreactor metagenome]|uniref:Uncharacterized protein n=1 Tax=bioreactor metagenome TaxID=1076179 RepID=A0A645EGE8_9ZZZZ
MQHGIVGNQWRQAVCRRRGTADIAHQRGAVADLDGGEVCAGLGQTGVVLECDVRGLDLSGGHQCAQAQTAFRSETEVIQARNLLDVDHMRRCSRMLFHHHQQIRTSGHQAGSACAALQQFCGLLQAGGFCILKELHACDSCFMRLRCGGWPKALASA